MRRYLESTLCFVLVTSLFTVLLGGCYVRARAHPVYVAPAPTVYVAPAPTVYVAPPAARATVIVR